MIYHIVPESGFRSCLAGSLYLPLGMAVDGFVHCSSAASVLPVANDYFSGVGDRLLLLEIDPGRLTSEIRYETPAPLAGGGASHLAAATQYPHVYGPINMQAIVRVGILERTPDGYRWPRALVPLDVYLAAGH